MRKKLTILTEPVNLTYNVRKVVYRTVGKEGQYGGHATRTRRMIEGINKLNYKDFNYQPKRVSDIGEHVHVLANVKTLRFAIELKRKGIIKKLTAGPNIVVFSDQYESIIADPAVDLYLQPSQWTADLHIRLEPRLAGRCEAFPYGGVGIDLEQYKPQNYNRAGNVLIYQKRQSNQLVYMIRRLLQKYGYNVTIITYGNYKLSEYIELANKSEFIVVVGMAESCGHFLTEAWAMDAPTICFDPHFFHWDSPRAMDVEGNVSTCPNLTEYTGTTFGDIHELEDILSSIDSYKKKFAPRNWVSENMTDERVSRLFLKKIGVIVN